MVRFVLTRVSTLLCVNEALIYFGRFKSIKIYKTRFDTFVLSLLSST